MTQQEGTLATSESDNQPTRATTIVSISAPVLLVTVMAVLAVLVASSRPAHGSNGSISLTTPGVAFVEATTDDVGTDPGYEKDIANCTVILPTADTIEVSISNAYPSYTCRVSATIENTGDALLRASRPEISTSAELTVLNVGPAPCGDLAPGEQRLESFTIHVKQTAEQEAVYGFSIVQRFLEAEPGTIGYWGSWNSHLSFPPEDIENWLTEIDDSSTWLGPVTTEGMDQVFAAGRGQGANPETRFLAHYLATRLNQRSGLLCSAEAHDVTRFDRNNHLALADPGAATLGEIIEAIEAKHGTEPTRQQLDSMRSICDELNNGNI